MTKEARKLKKEQKKVDDFNSKVKVGDSVQAQKTKSSVFETVTVKHEATILGGHTAVCWFNEFSGCHNMEFVKY